MARKGTDLLEGALRDLFGELDAERWDHVAENLDPDVELADEITGEWLRGSHRVGAYLRAQRGIVTEVRSTIGSVSTSRLADGLGLVTFTAGQRYRLGGAPRSETLSGSAIFAVNERGWKLRLLHLGEPSGADEVESAVLDAGRSARPGATLGESVRRVRATRGLSLRALSDRTGLSPSLLSQVERGLSDPSLSSLRRVAQALNVSVADLLGEQQQERASKVIRRTARTRLLSPGVGALHELLSGDVERIDARIVTIDPGVAGTEHAPHGGTEFVLVLEGSLEVMMGDTVEVLHLGDAATIEASMTHRVAASQDVPARYLWITVPQK